VARAEPTLSALAKRCRYPQAVVALQLGGWLGDFADLYSGRFAGRAEAVPSHPDGVGTVSPGRQALCAWTLRSEESVDPRVLTLWASAFNCYVSVAADRVFLNESGLGLSILWSQCFWNAFVLCCMESLREFRCWDMLDEIEAKILR